MSIEVAREGKGTKLPNWTHSRVENCGLMARKDTPNSQGGH